jgi:hypothetical protein
MVNRYRVQRTAARILRRLGAAGKARHVVGPRGGTTEIQALLFPRALWTLSKAKAWAKRNKYRYAKAHVTDEYIRLRQRDPGLFRRMRTKCLDKACSIKTVIGVR